MSTNSVGSQLTVSDDRDMAAAPARPQSAVRNFGSWLVSPVTGLFRGGQAAVSAAASVPGTVQEVHRVVANMGEITGQFAADVGNLTDLTGRTMLHLNVQAASALGTVQHAVHSTVPQINSSLNRVTNSATETAGEARTFFKYLNRWMPAIERTATVAKPVAASTIGAGFIAFGLTVYSRAEGYPDNRVRKIVQYAGLATSLVAGIFSLYTIGSAILRARTSQAPVQISDPLLEDRVLSDAEVLSVRAKLGNAYNPIAQHFEFTVFPKLQEYSAKLSGPECTIPERADLNRKLEQLVGNSFRFFKDAPITNSAERDNSTFLRKQFLHNINVLTISNEQRELFLNEGLSLRAPSPSQSGRDSPSPRSGPLMIPSSASPTPPKDVPVSEPSPSAVVEGSD